MGNRQRGHETAPWELDVISELVSIPRPQLENIYRDFRRVSKDYLLDKYEFRRIYKDLVKHSPLVIENSLLTRAEFNRRSHFMSDRIFRTFDRDGTGRLTFEEFIAAYIMLQNSISPQLRLNFLLSHYAQNNGYITPQMGRRVIQDVSNLYGINVDEQQVWRNLQAAHGQTNGLVPQQAFADYFLNHPAYSSALYHGVPMNLPPPSPPL